MIFEERHRIVTALTAENGLVTALAKNAVQSRRFGGSLDLFSVSEWQFQHSRSGEMLTLFESAILKSFENIRTDYSKLAMASFMCELVSRVAPQLQTCPDLFKLTYHGLDLLDQMLDTLSNFRTLNAFTLRVLHWSGTQPRLTYCMNCSESIMKIQESHVSYDAVRGGWTCAKCYHNSFALISSQTIRDFLLGTAYPIKQSITLMDGTIEEHQEGFEFLKQLLEYHTPGLDRTPLRTLQSLTIHRATSKNVSPAKS